MGYVNLLGETRPMVGIPRIKATKNRRGGGETRGLPQTAFAATPMLPGSPGKHRGRLKKVPGKSQPPEARKKLFKSTNLTQGSVYEGKQRTLKGRGEKVLMEKKIEGHKGGARTVGVRNASISSDSATKGAKI